MSPSISQRISVLENKNERFARYLKSALNYLRSDPHSALTKCRIVLEKLLSQLYIEEMGKEPNKVMVGNLLSNKEFSIKIPQRIRARMNLIREIANLGPHGGEDINNEDVRLVLAEAVYVAEWYCSKYNRYRIQKLENTTYVEVLALLKAKYESYLRPDIVSVKFSQTKDRSFLGITTSKYVADLMNETITRTDLGFISNDDFDGSYFNPQRDIQENVEN